MGRLIKCGQGEALWTTTQGEALRATTQGEALRATAQGEALWTTNTVKPSPVRTTAIKYSTVISSDIRYAYALTGLEIAVIAPWGFAPR